MRRSKHQADQTLLDFGAVKRERAQRYRLIESIPPARAGMKSVHWWQVCCLLKAVHYFDHGNGCTQSRDDLWAHVRESYQWEPTRYAWAEAKKRARKLGVLVVTERSQGEGRGRKVDLLRVKWEKLFALDERESITKTSEIITESAENTPRSTETITSSHFPGRCSPLAAGHDQEPKSDDQEPIPNDPGLKSDDQEPKLGSSLKDTPSKPLDSPSPSSPPASARPSPPHSRRGEGEFEELVEELLRLDVRAARKAVDAARTRGATAEQVWQVIRYWQQHQAAWHSPPYAIYLRLTQWSPGQSPRRGWLEPSEDYLRQQAVKRATEKRDRELSEREDFENGVARRWNALPAAERRRIGEAFCDIYPRVRGDHRRMVRWMLNEVRNGDRSAELTELLAPLIPKAMEFVR